MPSTTITSKGQVTIPKAVRDALGLKPGDRVAFLLQPDGRVLVEPETVDVRSLRGMLRREGETPVTVEEMNEAVARAAAS